MSKRTDFTRRDFLNRLAAAGAVTVGSSVLAACGGADSGGGDSGDSGASEAGDGGGEAAALNCSDAESLTDVEKTQRDALQYVEATEVADQDCTNCNQFVVAESEGGCGTCKVVPGPINPGGNCSVWVALEEA